MDPRLARRIAAVALITGVAGAVLFDRTAPGINVPIAILAALIAATAFRPAGRRVDRLDLWIPPVTMLAAVGVAIRADPLVILADMGLAFVGAVAWAAAVSVGSLTRRSVGALLMLVAVAGMAGRSRWFVPGAVGLLVLTAVILASAALRLGLYQQAYGWTELRFYVAAVIGWLAGCLGIALGLVLARRIRWLIHGVAFAAIAVVLAVTAIGPQAFITGQNVARALDPSLVQLEGKAGLDVGYVSGLGSGAIPVLVEALPRLDPGTRAGLLDVLERRRSQLDGERSTQPWPAWNLERAEARDALRSLPAR